MYIKSIFGVLLLDSYFYNYFWFSKPDVIAAAEELVGLLNLCHAADSDDSHVNQLVQVVIGFQLQRCFCVWETILSIKDYQLVEDVCKEFRGKAKEKKKCIELRSLLPPSAAHLMVRLSFFNVTAATPV
jgi:hypothetical protein